MNDEIKIEKGIPIPMYSGQERWLQIFRQMQVGDSFAILPDRSQQTVIIQSAKRIGAKVTTRRINQGKDKGKIRIWLVSKNANKK